MIQLSHFWVHTQRKWNLYLKMSHNDNFNDLYSFFFLFSLLNIKKSGSIALGPGDHKNPSVFQEGEKWISGWGLGEKRHPSLASPDAQPSSPKSVFHRRPMSTSHPFLHFHRPITFTRQKSKLLRLLFKTFSHNLTFFPVESQDSTWSLRVRNMVSSV